MASVAKTLFIALAMTLFIPAGMTQAQTWQLRVTDSNNAILPQAKLAVRAVVKNHSMIEQYTADEKGIIYFSQEDHPINNHVDESTTSKVSLEAICYVPNQSFNVVDLMTKPEGGEMEVHLSTPRMTPFTIQTEDGLRLPEDSLVCGFIEGWSAEIVMEPIPLGEGVSLLPVRGIESGRYEIGLPWSSQGVYLLIHNEDIIRYHVVGPFSGDSTTLEEKVIILPTAGNLKTTLAFNQTRPSGALPQTSIQVERIFPGNYHMRLQTQSEPDQCSNYALIMEKLAPGDYITTYRTIKTPPDLFGPDHPEYFLKKEIVNLRNKQNVNKTMRYDPFRFSDIQGNSTLWIYIANADKTPAMGKDYSLYVGYENVYLPVNRGTVPQTGIVKIEEMKAGLAYEIRIQNGNSNYRKSLNVMPDRAQATFYLTLPEIDDSDEKPMDLIAVTQQKF